ALIIRAAQRMAVGVEAAEGDSAVAVERALRRRIGIVDAGPARAHLAERAGRPGAAGVALAAGTDPPGAARRARRAQGEGRGSASRAAHIAAPVRAALAGRARIRGAASPHAGANGAYLARGAVVVGSAVARLRVRARTLGGRLRIRAARRAEVSGQARVAGLPARAVRVRMATRAAADGGAH